MPASTEEGDSDAFISHECFRVLMPGMALRLKPFRFAFRAASNPSPVTSRRSFISLPLETPIDEETLPHYDPKQFYPVRIGDLFNRRYRVTGKLGYGAHSTSWLCQDIRYLTP